MTEDRRPQNSPEAERGILGCILLSPSECLAACQTALKGGSEAFYDLRHRTLYEEISELHEKRGIADLFAMQEHLRRKGMMEAVGGIAYVAGLPNEVPSAANLHHYLSIVCGLYVRRMWIGFATDSISKCQEHTGDVDELVDELEADALRIGNLRLGHLSDGGMMEAGAELEAELEEAWANKHLGLTTGLWELDAKLGGLGPGQVIVIGAASSDGKSALAGHILKRNLEAGIPCGLFTLEMSRAEAIGRLASEKSGVPFEKTWRGLDEQDMQGFSAALKLCRKLPLKICDESGITIAQLYSRARRWVKDGVKLLAVDYAQLVEAGLKGNPNRTVEVSHVTKRVKAMARELKVPVLLLSQLSRDHKKNNRPPRLDDLRESGSMEQDADKVILMHRKSANDPDNATLMCLNVAKHRNGARGPVELLFNMPVFRFENMPEEGR